ncbi:hypothetical protein BJ508DRAFT_333805 [Ascobolus immersus RN42]|uniref:Uncharacterized protein n=1 Tax=Ascobolus immersus RN42 TaxID=1160509 RepID=A0A3N4HI86_ASCIM|nr:hypothetical protein BJ508DRAFT_333805 [Ascobolus immersus RN42]
MLSRPVACKEDRKALEARYERMKAKQSALVSRIALFNVRVEDNFNAYKATKICEVYNLPSRPFRPYPTPVFNDLTTPTEGSLDVEELVLYFYTHEFGRWRSNRLLLEKQIAVFTVLFNAYDEMKFIDALYDLIEFAQKEGFYDGEMPDTLMGMIDVQKKLIEAI